MLLTLAPSHHYQQKSYWNKKAEFFSPLKHLFEKFLCIYDSLAQYITSTYILLEFQVFLEIIFRNVQYKILMILSIQHSRSLREIL